MLGNLLAVLYGLLYGTIIVKLVDELFSSIALVNTLGLVLLLLAILVVVIPLAILSGEKTAQWLRQRFGR